jgi:hypothetical protein
VPPVCEMNLTLLGVFVEDLSFYKDGFLYRLEEHSTRDTLLQDFKMKNGDVYKISKLLSRKIDSDSLICYFNKNGSISDKYSVKWINGIYFKNGIYQKFNDDGKLVQTILYDMGNEKLSRTFHDNGKLKLEISYDNKRNRTRKDFDENGKEIKEYLVQLNKEGRTLVMVTHDLSLAKIASRNHRPGRHHRRYS